MDNKINLSQLADLLAQAGGMTKAASEQFVKNFFDIISQAVLAEGLVKVKGLGTFKLVQMEDRESVNVNSGERFTIEGHQKISFIPDADLKERINKPFAAFETVEITEEQAAQLDKMEQNSNSSTIKTTDSMEKGKEKEPKNAPKESKKEVKEEEKKSCWNVWIKILIAILVIALIIILLWPVIGNKCLKKADKQPAKEKAPAPAAVQPAPEKKPEAQPAKKETAKFTLTKEDQNKALPRFTAADTVNYKIVGTKATVTMVKGDMLTTIAEKYYGTKKLWPYVAKYNGLTTKSARKLPVGYKIKVPELANK
ncbi:MAG: HU family DNA-binding protein [Bacteroidaceae bacterium]|nr:HU family DNA-binding protein [Bacteroidaceae bacterium]